jgi:hypothetical protein
MAHARSSHMGAHLSVSLRVHRLLLWGLQYSDLRRSSLVHGPSTAEDARASGQSVSGLRCVGLGMHGHSTMAARIQAWERGRAQGSMYYLMGLAYHVSHLEGTR